MDLHFDAETEAFRAEVREFLAANTAAFPTESYDTAAGFEQHRRWDKVLFDAGLSVIAWPEKYGGRDATRSEERRVGKEGGPRGAEDSAKKTRQPAARVDKVSESVIDEVMR